MNTTQTQPPPLRVLIVDDEDLARARLKTLLAECASPRARVVGEAASSALALGWLENNACDVMLLDIQMPGADGRQLGRLLRQRATQGQRVPAIVFVTAHAEHALEAFELDAADYLTKPVRRERLAAALQRVAQRLAQPAPAAAAPVHDEPVIVVNDRGRVLRVPLSQVLYLRAEQKYVTLRTAEHSYVLDEALADLEQRVGERFLRVHRNALVARHAVRALERKPVPANDDESGEGWAVQVAPLGEWLAVSRRQLTAVREALAAEGL
jgi:two-component system, LytTR family, response regulator AlgR